MKDVVSLNMMPFVKDNAALEFRNLIWNKGEKGDLRKLYFIPALTVFCPHNQKWWFKKKTKNKSSTKDNKYHMRLM